jgi:predicted DNA binding CopG/RHH family protein
MSANIKYTNEPMDDPRVIRDFLPSPEELAFRDEDVKITTTLSKKSVEFFKSAATRGHTQYQRMIRRLLDAYVDAHAGAPVRGPVRARKAVTSRTTSS